jgi:HEAT repeat protein
VFALSQRDEPERIDHLLRVARTHPNPEVVRSAFFWLAESADERAIDFFEDVLRVRQ